LLNRSHATVVVTELADDAGGQLAALRGTGSAVRRPHVRDGRVHANRYETNATQVHPILLASAECRAGRRYTPTLCRAGRLSRTCFLGILHTPAERMLELGLCADFPRHPGDHALLWEFERDVFYRKTIAAPTVVLRPDGMYADGVRVALYLNSSWVVGDDHFTSASTQDVVSLYAQSVSGRLDPQGAFGEMTLRDGVVYAGGDARWRATERGWIQHPSARYFLERPELVVRDASPPEPRNETQRKRR
jgi:hypothetical protein